MLSMPLRKQGGAAVITVPAAVVQALDLRVGEALAMDVQGGSLIVTPVQPRGRKRHTLADLLAGASPKTMRALHDETAWARSGAAIGRELA